MFYGDTVGVVDAVAIAPRAVEYFIIGTLVINTEVVGPFYVERQLECEVYFSEEEHVATVTVGIVGKSNGVIAIAEESIVDRVAEVNTG